MADPQVPPIKEAAAAPSGPLDVTTLMQRARRQRYRHVAFAAAVAVISLIALVTIPQLGDRREQPADERGPHPVPTPSTIVEYQNGNMRTHIDYEKGFAFLYPRGWDVVEGSLTPRLVDPKELFSVASTPIEYEAGDCHNLPKSAFDQLSSTDAFLSVQERDEPDPGDGKGESYPDRKIFTPEEVEPSEGFMCVENPDLNVYWFPFRDSGALPHFSNSGRNFYALIVVGKDADRRTSTAPWFVLNNATFFDEGREPGPGGHFYPHHYYNAHGANVIPVVFPDGTRGEVVAPLSMELEKSWAVPYAYVRLGRGCCALQAEFRYGSDQPFRSYARPTGRIFPAVDEGAVEEWGTNGQGDLLLFRADEWRVAISTHNQPKMSDAEKAELASSLQIDVTPEGFPVLEPRGRTEILHGTTSLAPSIGLWAPDRSVVLVSSCDRRIPLQIDNVESGWTITDLGQRRLSASWCQDGAIQVSVQSEDDTSIVRTAVDALRVRLDPGGDTRN